MRAAAVFTAGAEGIPSLKITVEFQAEAGLMLPSPINCICSFLLYLALVRGGWQGQICSPFIPDSSMTALGIQGGLILVFPVFYAYRVYRPLAFTIRLFSSVLRPHSLLSPAAASQLPVLADGRVLLGKQQHKGGWGLAQLVCRWLLCAIAVRQSIQIGPWRDVRIPCTCEIGGLCLG